MLILKSVERRPVHGFGISLEIRARSKEILQVEQGSLYPALYRLEDQGLIRSEWGVSENNRRARFYSLTAAGKKRLAVEAANWERVSAAVNLVLGHAG
jgi:PadR family transcriptional regulator, regulatory protein PadR